MLLQLEGIGKQKIEYKDPKTIEFDTLSNYLLLAKKSISKFANTFYNGLATKMLRDEDAISNVAYAIMMADWRYDENHANEEGASKTKYSYRNQCALWAIQTHITKSSKNKLKKRVYSLDYKDNDESMSYGATVDSKIKSPEAVLYAKEKTEDIQNLINSLLCLDCLSNKQKDYIKLYYFDNYTFEQIGKKYGLTREAVRQSMNKALNLIRESVI
jgi:RNA polymerase sigma factor (sigma-70 family)